MKCYKITGTGVIHFAPTQQGAKDFKKGFPKGTPLMVEQTDIPIGKLELLSFINALIEVASARGESSSDSLSDKEDTDDEERSPQTVRARRRGRSRRD